MFNWYRDAAICYAYLEDVHSAVEAETVSPVSAAFRDSRWFTRGWTLQELLAPSTVVFYSCDWVEIGTRDRLKDSIASITKISRDFFMYGSLSNFSIAQKMSWACRRETTRIEDEAYCLLGLFGVNMPLLYGEGKRAFFRLQEAIMNDSDDQSIFAWSTEEPEDQNDPLYNKFSRNLPDGTSGGLLATSPTQFWKSSLIVRCQHDKDNQPYSVTNKGIQIRLPILDPETGYSMPFVPFQGTKYQGSAGVQLTLSPTGSLAVLNCQVSREKGSKVALVIEKNGTSETYVRTNHILGWIPLSEAEIKEKAQRRSVLIQTHNLASDGLLWSNEKRGRLVLMQPLPSAVSSFGLKKVVTETKWRSQENGGFSFRLRNSWKKNKVALVYEQPHELETFLLVFEAKGTRGDETAVVVRLVPNLKDPSSGEIRKHLGNDECISADEHTRGKVVNTPQGSVSLHVYVKEAPHASLVNISTHAPEPPTAQIARKATEVSTT